MNNKTSNIDCLNCDEKNCDPFALNNDELVVLSNNRRTINYNKNETIFKQSTYSSHVVYVQSGLVKLFTEGQNGKNVILRFISKGEFIGLPFLFNNNYVYYSATAIKDTSVCMIEKNIYAKLAYSNPSLCQKIINLIAMDTGILYEKMTTLGTKQLHGRLANAILELSDDKLIAEDIYSYITKKELAEFSGMSAESLMRLLNEFKADKIINTVGKRIEINDFEMLSKLSQLG